MKINSTQESPLVVTCALIKKNGRILLAQRSDSGLWELPGGKVEPGEDLPTCLVREITEELGVRVEVTNALSVVEDHTPDGRPISLHAFSCRLNGGRPRVLEHLALAWHTLVRALELDLCPADRRLLTDLMNQEAKKEESSTSPGT